MILTTWSAVAADGTASLAEHVRLSLRTTTAQTKTSAPTSSLRADQAGEYDLTAVTTAVHADLENHLPAGVTTDGTTFYLHVADIDEHHRTALVDEVRALATANPMRFWYLADTHRHSRPCTTLSGDWMTDWLTTDYTPAERLAAARITLAMGDRVLPQQP